MLKRGAVDARRFMNQSRDEYGDTDTQERKIWEEKRRSSRKESQA